MIYAIEISADLDDKLESLPGSTRARKTRLLEKTINRFLDAEGWPQYSENPLGAVVKGPWFVVLRDRGRIHGHVGPIVDRKRADRVAKAWAGSRYSARVEDKPAGDCLTNIEKADLL